MSITRRSLLQGLTLGAGALLLDPFLRRLQAFEEGDRRKPWRVLFVLQANGFQPWAAQPRKLPLAEVGPEKPVSLALEDYDLPADLDPLTDFRAITTIVQRLSGTQTFPIHTAGFGALSGTKGRLKPAAETIDACLARSNPALFPIVNLGVSTTQKTGLVKISSAWGADQPIATQLDPALAWRGLFGLAPEDETGLIDHAREDIRRVTARLTTEQREQFAQHLDAFESLDQKRHLFRKAESAPLAAVDVPTPGDSYRSTEEARRLEAQFELARVALTSGLTNVVTIASGACEVEGYFRGLGVDNLHLHQVGHFRTDGKQKWEDIYTTIRRHHIGLIAKLVDSLRQVSDPDGTPMMDNTLIVYTSDGADAHHSRGKQWPFVLIGNLNGRLKAGRFLEYPSEGTPGNRTINALYCTLLHAAGVGRDHFNAHNLPRPAKDADVLGELLA